MTYIPQEMFHYPCTIREISELISIKTQMQFEHGDGDLEPRIEEVVIH